MNDYVGRHDRRRFSSAVNRNPSSELSRLTQAFQGQPAGALA
jgi:hypothetical protein